MVASFAQLSDLISSRGVFTIGEDRLEWRRVEPTVAGTDQERPCLVLLHEGLGCVALWRGFPEALVRATGLSAFSYSRVGYGRSSPAPGPLSLDYHQVEAHAVLPRVLAAAGIRHPILIGHSDGGTIALIYAATAEPAPLAVVTMAAHVFNEETTRRGIMEARKAFTGSDLRSRLAVYHGNNVDNAFWGWCDTWLSAGFRNWTVEAALPGVDCPVLVLQGECDQYGTAAQVSAIASGVSGPARALMLPDCGHAPHLEQPADTCAVLAAFLADHGVG